MTSIWHDYNVIARGANRICVAHHKDPALCIKFDLDAQQAKGGFANTLRRCWARWLPANSFAEQELRQFQALKRRAGPAVTQFFAEPLEVIESDQGKGLVCRRVLNSDATPAQPIHYYYAHESTLALSEMVQAIERFGDFLRRFDVPLFDLNAGNLLVQQTNSGLQMVCVDIKSLGKSKEIIPLSTWFKPLRQQKISRRIERLIAAVRSRKIERTQ